MTASSARADSLYLGIDGGGTKTIAVVVDAQGIVRGRGGAGGANQESVGTQAALDAVWTAAQAALCKAESASPCAAAWIGLAGVDGPRDVVKLFPRLEPLAQVVRITNDAELLLGTLPGGVGIALVAGTGSIAVGRNAAGESSRCGGWGHIFGDEGGGYAIGCAGLRAVAKASDGRGQATALTDAILCALSVAEPSALIPRIYPTVGKAEIARLASTVIAAAETGDEVALAILQREAGELALQGQALARVLQLGGDTEPLPVALGGTLLTRAPLYRTLLQQHLERACRCEPVVVVEEPALEAARAARALFGDA